MVVSCCQCLSAWIIHAVSSQLLIREDLQVHGVKEWFNFTVISNFDLLTVVTSKNGLNCAALITIILSQGGWERGYIILGR